MISGGMGADDGRRFYSTLMGPKLFDGNASVHFLMEVHPYYICPARADSSCDGDPAAYARADSSGRHGASDTYYLCPARADSSCDGDLAAYARADSSGRNDGASGIHYGDPAKLKRKQKTPD